MSTPNNRGNKNGGKRDDQNRPKFNTILPIAVLVVAFVLLFNFLYTSYAESMMEEIKYNEFKQMLENGVYKADLFSDL